MYTILIKPDPTADISGIESVFAAADGVLAVDVSTAQISGLTRKEALLAITLSVTANFATDGLKLIIDQLNPEERERIVYCRRADGEEVDLSHLGVSRD